MNQREDYHEAINIKARLHEKSGKANTRLHPSEQVRQRPGQAFAWLSVSTQRLGGSGTPRIHQQALLLRGGNLLMVAGIKLG